MAVFKTSAIGIAGEPQTTGFTLTGGTTTQKTLTVSETSTIDQNLSTTSTHSMSGLNLSGTTVDGIETTITNTDTKIPTSGAVIDYVSANLETIQEITSDITAENGKTYIANKSGSICVITLPASFAIGDKIGVIGKGSTKFKIVANTGDTIIFLNLTTKGGGYVEALDQYASLQVVRIVTDTTWTVRNSNGSFNVEIS